MADISNYIFIKGSKQSIVDFIKCKVMTGYVKDFLKELDESL